MAESMIDISMIGDKELQRLLDGLPEKAQRRVVGPAVKRTAERLKNEWMLNLSGRIVEEKTGRYVDAVESEKARIFRGGVGKPVVAGVKLPSSAALGMGTTKAERAGQEYYPAILEYGYSTPDRHMEPKRTMRRAVDDHADREIRLLARDIGKGIERVARQLAK